MPPMHRRPTITAARIQDFLFSFMRSSLLLLFPQGEQNGCQQSGSGRDKDGQQNSHGVGVAGLRSAVVGRTFTCIVVRFGIVSVVVVVAAVVIIVVVGIVVRFIGDDFIAGE